MTSRDQFLESRLSELELEVIRLRRELQRLEASRAPAPTPKAEPPRYAPPGPRTEIHQRRVYEFEAKLPPARLIVDFLSRNKTTNEVVHVGTFSPAQITYALQKFSRLKFPTRRLWKGKPALYSVARRLFAQAGQIQQHKGSRVWHWANANPGERRACAARIAASLSLQK